MKIHTENAYSDSTFRFNGMEWDEEPTGGSSRAPLKAVACEQTGNFYYVARYYDPKISVWLSVDPLASNYPYISPYNFVENNPLKFIDPTGMGPEDLSLQTHMMREGQKH
ncbi:RHS repeat domain-containing protein [Croceimicrobium sp.]|uniref:RHS repeat domain-containing protein n=1 Tax=Croceimicrobium sp. TaxID=2828340 RepID=UPI003BA97593